MNTLQQFSRQAKRRMQGLPLGAWRRRLALGLGIAAIAILPIPGAASRPSAAFLTNFEPKVRNSEFWIRNGNRRELIDSESQNLRMGTDDRLSVPTGYSASFTFEGGDNSYSGLVVTARNRGIYVFPCEIQGNFIIGWQSEPASSPGRRDACNQEGYGIEICRRTDRCQTRLSSSNSLVGLKQADTPAVDANLSVVPGDSQTVIRVTSTPMTAQITQRRTVGCTPATCLPESDNRIPFRETIEEKVDVETERVTIEVLEGDVAVQAEGAPSATTVSKGQRYVYPNPAIDSFDPSQAGSSCEMLHFLNPATHLVDDELPSSLVTGITAQLKDHRNAMGVTGRPPSNLSALEQAVVAELNRARTNPQGYADLVEANKQDFYNNWLQLPGFPLDPDERRSLVDEAIAFLRQQSSLPELDVSDGMSQGNQFHVEDQGKISLNRGHTGDNSTGPRQRLEVHGSFRHCRGLNAISHTFPSYENIVYLDSPTAQRVVIEMLIGDDPTQAGYEDAGDLDNLFNPDFQVMGVACGTHGYLRNMCVITYASGYIEGT